MARSVYSSSPSPLASPSPSFSEISMDDSDDSEANNEPDGLGPSVSRPNSPLGMISLPSPVTDDVIKCLWEDCGIIFTHLPTLIQHIHDDHIGVHKSNYTCEWATCSRRGLAQTSRFALISHIRSHTGEKPFTCLRPECDKSFTRSDALAKHMRLQHNIDPPAPGRGGGSRKRKREIDLPLATHLGLGTYSPYPSENDTPLTTQARGNAGGQAGFNTFKLEPRAGPSMSDEHLGSDVGAIITRDRHFTRSAAAAAAAAVAAAAASARPQSASPPYSPTNTSFHANHNGNGNNRNANGNGTQNGTAVEPYDSPDFIPAYLVPHISPTTDLIFGRSQPMVMYLIMKAKHRHALQQHEELLEQLRVIREDLRREKQRKEEAVSALLRGVFGPQQAEPLIRPIPEPVQHHPRVYSRNDSPGASPPL